MYVAITLCVAGYKVHANAHTQGRYVSAIHLLTYCFAEKMYFVG